MSALGNLPSDYKETEARAFKEADDYKSDRPKRTGKFVKALQAASAYKQKKAAENEIDAAMGKNDDDEKKTQGFKIAPDATVVEGYRDPGYTIPGQQGRSLLGPLGAGLSTFFPVTGGIISTVGSVTGY